MWTDLCLGASVVMAAFIVAIVAPIVANAMVNAERERPHRVTAAETACPNDGAPASGTAAAAAMPGATPSAVTVPKTAADRPPAFPPRSDGTVRTPNPSATQSPEPPATSDTATQTPSTDADDTANDGRQQPATAHPESVSVLPPRPPHNWIIPPLATDIRTVESGVAAGLDELGEPSEYAELEHRPVNDAQASSAPTAVALDMLECHGATAASVSIRGVGHRDFRHPRQDAAAIRAVGERIVAVVCDGVSASPRSHIGAASACKAVLSCVQRQLEEGIDVDRIDWPQVTDAVRATLREQASRLLKPQHGTSGDADRQTADADAVAAQLLGTTCDVLVVDVGGDTPRFTRATLSGDGFGYLVDAVRGIEFLGSTKVQPDAADPASTTAAGGTGGANAVSADTTGAAAPANTTTVAGGRTGTEQDVRLASSAVRPLPADPGDRFPMVVSGRLLRGRQAVAIVSDGLGDDLRDGSTAASGYLFRRLVRPIPQHELLRIASYLKLGSTDDRSAVIVWL